MPHAIPTPQDVLSVTVPQPAEMRHGDGGRVLPDVESLEAPRALRRDIFRPGEDLDTRMLHLAAAVNDLRHALWAGRQADFAMRHTPGLDGYDGAVSGLQLWSAKMMAGTLHEMLQAIRPLASRSASVVALIADSDLRQAWDDVVSLAGADTRIEGSDRHFLDRARNALAYHYTGDIDRLAEGYGDAFLAGNTPYNRFAWMSTSDRLSGLHFFFVDAALQRALESLAGAETAFDRISRLATTVAYGSAVLVAAFMHWRREVLQLESAG